MVVVRVGRRRGSGFGHAVAVRHDVPPSATAVSTAVPSPASEFGPSTSRILHSGHVAETIWRSSADIKSPARIRRRVVRRLAQLVDLSEAPAGLRTRRELEHGAVHVHVGFGVGIVGSRRRLRDRLVRTCVDTGEPVHGSGSRTDRGRCAPGGSRTGASPGTRPPRPRTSCRRRWSARAGCRPPACSTTVRTPRERRHTASSRRRRTRRDCRRRTRRTARRWPRPATRPHPHSSTRYPPRRAHSRRTRTALHPGRVECRHRAVTLAQVERPVGDGGQGARSRGSRRTRPACTP